MHDPDPALDVVEGVSGEGAPRGRRREEPDGRPRVDRDGAVLEPRERLVEADAELLEGGRRGDDVGSERADEQASAG